MTTDRHKIDSLQALRAFAASFVMLFHGSFILSRDLHYVYLKNFFMVGFTGVDIFFILSGFIIFYSTNPANFKLGKFLKKRFIRIFPVYWLVIIGLIILHQKASAGGAGKYSPGEILASFTLYPLFPNSRYVLGVAWTLTYEALFYLLIAFTFISGLKTFYYTFAAWLVIILITYFCHIEAANYALNSLINPIVLNFAFGCVLGVLYRKYPHFKQWRWFAIGGAVLLIGTWSIFYQHHDNFPSLMSRVYLFGIPSAIMIFGLIYNTAKVPLIFVAIGDASYSLYLIHAAVLALLLQIVVKLHLEKPAASFAGTTLLFAITIAISVVFYRLIERPLIKWLHKKML